MFRFTTRFRLNQNLTSGKTLIRHGYRRATFPPGEGFVAVPLNYNLIHKKGIDYLEKCGMIIMYRYASIYGA